ncbi:MAG: acyl carrier protein [Planctomycetota bacterium]
MDQLSRDQLHETILQWVDGMLQQRHETSVGSVQPQDVLLESGLDSLGFAILVSRLEDELGYDPFSEADEVYYPQTFADFIAFYDKHQP